MADPAAPADTGGAPDAGLAVVLTTVPGIEAGEALVRALVEEGLIACGNLIPGLRSIYRWEGKVVAESEVLAVLKTASTSVGPVFERVTRLHPYSVPEIVELRTGNVASAYLAWVMSCMKGGE